MPNFTIYLGADHRGFEKKNQLIELLADCHPGMVQVEDLGAYEYVQDDDFNDPAKAVTQAVLANDHSFGVLLCGSGQGVCMQANRSGARAICVKTPADAQIGREHDWANVVCMPADELSAADMEKIVKAFCHAQPLDDERHQRRMHKLEEP